MSAPVTTPVTACPDWCTGEHAKPDFHQSVQQVLRLGSYAGETGVAGILTAQARTQPVVACDGPAPRVELLCEQNTGCDGLTSMTPAEALVLAGALARAALTARQEPPPAEDGCPAWCDDAGHHHDPSFHSTRVALTLAAYETTEAGQVIDGWMFASLRQHWRGGQAFVIVDLPDCDPVDPDGLAELPERQIMLTTAEAAELGTGLLRLAADPEGVHAGREAAGLTAAAQAASGSAS